MLRVQYEGREYLVWMVNYEFRDKYFKLHKDTFRFGSHPLPISSQIFNEYAPWKISLLTTRK
jgi:hypothetical protein